MISRIILYIAIGFVFLFGYIKFLEQKSVFFPNKIVKVNPEILHMPFEDVYFGTKDNLKINGWFIPTEGSKYTILYFHGNAGNLADRLEKIELLKKIGLNIFIIDYRGFGKSQGRPTEKGVYLDADAAYDYLIKDRKIGPDQIVLFGESIGSAVAIELASKVKVRGMILEGAFSKAKDMVNKIYPLLPAFLFSNMYDSLSKIKNISCPKLFIHSKNDEIVPFKLAQKLFYAAKEPKKLIEVSGEHNDVFWASQDEFISSITEFIKELK